MTEKRLKEVWRIFNQAFFDSELIEPDVLQFRKMPKHDGLFQKKSVKSEVISSLWINKDFQTHPDVAVMVMLHEMIHQKMEDHRSCMREHDEHCSYRWGAEVTRLFNIGAYQGLL